MQMTTNVMRPFTICKSFTSSARASASSGVRVTQNENAHGDTGSSRRTIRLTPYATGGMEASARHSDLLMLLRRSYDSVREITFDFQDSQKLTQISDAAKRDRLHYHCKTSCVPPPGLSHTSAEERIEAGNKLRENPPYSRGEVVTSQSFRRWKYTYALTELLLCEKQKMFVYERIWPQNGRQVPLEMWV